MQHAILKKSHFDDFISKLSHDKKIIAPVSKGFNNFAFEHVKSADNISLKYIPTILPPKKYFFPHEEKLLEFDTKFGQNMQAISEYENLVLFGVHTCDLAGIQCLNMVFSERPRDVNYLFKKNKILIIGLECNDYCDDYASCALMDNDLPNGGYDLFFTDMGEYFIVHINTYPGELLIEETNVFEDANTSHHQELKKLREKKKEIFKDELPISHNDITNLFDKCYESKVWEDIGKRCLSCGNCTNVCPTCYCFDVFDEMNLDLKTGYRSRRWDSCQSETFAKVAGGENFRKKTSDRQRHRYYRKFKYPVERFSRHFCTGCGRCSRTCMASINLKETLNELIKENG